MKIKITLFAIVFGLLFLVGSSLATTGDHEFFLDIGYNSTKNTIVALQSLSQSTSLLECPIPKIGKSISGCDTLINTLSGEEKDPYEEFKKLNLISLQRIDLKSNKFTIDINNIIYPETTNTGYIGAFDQYNSWSQKIGLTVSVLQDNIEKANFNTDACLQLFDGVGAEGFLIPGTKKIVLVARTYDQCYETGYFSESLFFIDDVALADSSALPSRNLDDIYNPEIDPIKSMNLFSSFSREPIDKYIYDVAIKIYNHAIVLSNEGQYGEAVNAFEDAKNTITGLGLPKPIYGQAQYDKSMLQFKYQEIEDRFQRIVKMVDDGFSEDVVVRWVGNFLEDANKLEKKDFYISKVVEDDRFNYLKANEQFSKLVGQVKTPDDLSKKTNMGIIWIYSLVSVLVVSLISFIGVLFIGLNEERLKKFLLYLVSFSAGGLFGGAFIHLLPEAVKENGFSVNISLFVILGIVFSFFVEKIIHWRHCHLPVNKHHIHHASLMSLVGDSIHNLIDGLILGATYLVSIPLGIATTIAVIIHEIPQEIGDFGVLVYGGFSKKKALFLNFLTALTSFLGVIISLLLSHYTKELTTFLIPFAAGSFIYIAGSDLIPELHKECKTSKSILELFIFILGIAIMLFMLLLE
jgi:zinc and cadmium transporter